MATRSLNKVLLIGNLTRDVELRYTSGGTAVASFGIATNRTYNDASGTAVETAEFTNIVAWAKLGEICSQLLKKGSKVYIEGRLQTSKWDDKETGKSMQRTEVVASDMLILSQPGGAGGSKPKSGQNEFHDVAETKSDDEMGQSVDLNDLDLGDPVDDKSSEGKSDDSDKGDSSDTPF
ncbi:single-stranded DNA-binding protein [candidate division WWE3 bacterium CG_4_9_14_3_um_filter_34_6]|uniref:Single-stranded DNA-binding protein n=1 Tax=candidate division WWE3 bacterium CG_4_9_14_3_um_filter_34_6 TaxID=1975079 RepID=A0A2M7X2M5_UNCKA|nr:MAG: single-stranded DNA-binding protein [candidate division WWE3 bacterium CG_4_9_14_3_um_filter_34_6]